jgi:hypothetical protein
VGQYIETVAGVARLLRRAAELAWTQADVAGPRFWRALAQVVQPCHRDPGPHKSVAAAIAHVARGRGLVVPPQGPCRRRRIHLAGRPVPRAHYLGQPGRPGGPALVIGWRRRACGLPRARLPSYAVMSTTVEAVEARRCAAICGGCRRVVSQRLPVRISPRVSSKNKMYDLTKRYRVSTDPPKVYSVQFEGADD